MKLNIQVELEWLGEDGSLDEEVQNQIISGVKAAISKDCLKLVEDKTQKAIEDGMNVAIETMQLKVTTFFEDWLNNEAVITDRYGDKIEEGSLTDIIKRDFNNCMNEKVDAEGRPTTSSYGSKYTRLEFVTGKKVREVVNDYLASYGKDIDEKIKESIAKGIKDRVSDKFAEMVIGYAKQDYDRSKAIEHNQ